MTVPPTGWVETDCLVDRHPEISDEEAQAAIDMATWALWVLTGEKFHAAGCWQEEYEVYGCDLRVGVGPVTVVHTVESGEPCGDSWVPLDGWCITGPSSISICNGGSYDFRSNFGWSNPCGRPNRVRVRYSVDSNLPPGSPGVVCRLADEYYKAATGQACSLPERITSITRQGVSWTVLDPQTFFERGMTGIGPIDHWLMIARMYVGIANMTDPLRGRLIKAQQCVEPFAMVQVG